MPLFAYSARNEAGDILRGTVNALSAQAARDSLKEMNLEAEELYETSERRESPKPQTLHVNTAAPLPTSPAPTYGLPSSSNAPPQKTISTPASSSPLPFERPAPLHVQKEPSPDTLKYYPLFDTLRLYAGWLLSWYFLIFAFGSYVHTRSLPFEIPLVSSLFQSPVIISFALGAFLFLLLTEIHRLLGKGLGKGLILTTVWFLVFVLYKMNM